MDATGDHRDVDVGLQAAWSSDLFECSKRPATDHQSSTRRALALGLDSRAFDPGIRAELSECSLRDSCNDPLVDMVGVGIIKGDEPPEDARLAKGGRKAVCAGCLDDLGGLLWARLLADSSPV